MGSYLCSFMGECCQKLIMIHKFRMQLYARTYRAFPKTTDRPAR